MDRRQAYEIEVLSVFARLGSRAAGLSDADRDREFLAQRTFFPALALFRREVESALALSELRKDALAELLAALADLSPDAESWAESIAEQIRGY